MTRAGQTVHIDVSKMRPKADPVAVELQNTLNALRNRVNELLARNTELVEQRRKRDTIIEDLRKETRQLNAFAQKKEQEANRLHQQIVKVRNSLGIDDAREDNKPSA